MDSNELKKREAKKKKLENELKMAQNNCLQQKKFCDFMEGENVVSGQKYLNADKTGSTNKV